MHPFIGRQLTIENQPGNAVIGHYEEHGRPKGAAFMLEMLPLKILVC